MATAAAMLAFAGGASAGKPVVEKFTIDDTFGLDCGGAVTLVQRVVGTIHAHWQVDDAGTITAGVAAISLRWTITNPATGQSLTTRNAGVDRITVHADGSATIALAGLFGRWVIPGEGLIAASVGRVIFYEGESDHNPDVLFETPKAGGDLAAAACEALA